MEFWTPSTMSRSTDEAEGRNTYDARYQRLIESGESANAAVEAVVEAYLDGKPRNLGKTKIARAERDAAFWSSEFVSSVPSESWRSDLLTLALARYLAQEGTANTGLLERIGAAAPDAVCRAVRYSGLVLRAGSARRAELDCMAASNPEISELCQVLSNIAVAHKERVAAVDHWKAALSELSPFELLIYASLYAFEHLVPRRFDVPNPVAANVVTGAAWQSLNDLLVWKLTTATGARLKLRESDIGKSLAKHLAPFLFPWPTGNAARHDLRAAYRALFDAQVEVNSFVAQVADAFSYDDGIRFVRRGGRLEIEEVDAALRVAWQRNGRKLERLHGYWFYRAVDEFVSSGKATEFIGRPDNHEDNRLAYIRAIRPKLPVDFAPIAPTS